METDDELHNKLDAIQTKIEAGMMLRAAIELQNVLNNRPNELDVWNMLAEMYYEAGFSDAAGKYWLFYPSNELRVVKSVELYRDSMNHSATKILKDVKFRGDKLKLPKFSREILEELELESILNKGHAPQYKRIQHGKKNIKHQSSDSGGCVILFLAIIIGLISIFVIGVRTVINYFF